MLGSLPEVDLIDAVELSADERAVSWMVFAVGKFLQDYGFDMGSQPWEAQVQTWLETFPEDWIPAAVLEAFYQGRYKLVSIQQILQFWQRRGSPKLSFDVEFCLQLWPQQMKRIRTLRRHCWEADHIPSGWNWDPATTITIETLSRQLQRDGIPPRLQRLLSEAVTTQTVWIDLGSSPPQVLRGQLALDRMDNLAQT